MTHTHPRAILALCAAAALLLIGLTAYNSRKAEAGAFSGLQTSIATTSVNTVNTTQSLVFATSTGCTSRTISTRESAILIGFSDVQGFLPNGFQGHIQAASTTVNYDSGTYGCDALRIYSFTAQNITVSESRGQK